MIKETKLSHTELGVYSGNINTVFWYDAKHRRNNSAFLHFSQLCPLFDINRDYKLIIKYPRKSNGPLFLYNLHNTFVFNPPKRKPEQVMSFNEWQPACREYVSRNHLSPIVQQWVCAASSGCWKEQTARADVASHSLSLDYEPEVRKKTPRTHTRVQNTSTH